MMRANDQRMLKKVLPNSKEILVLSGKVLIVFLAVIGVGMIFAVRYTLSIPEYRDALAAARINYENRCGKRDVLDEEGDNIPVFTREGC